MQDRPLNLFEYEKLASELGSEFFNNYLNASAGEGITAKSNVSALQRIRLLPHAFRDAGHQDLKVQVLDRRLEIPLMIAPMSFQCVAHPSGESGLARAASKCGAGMVLSTLSSKSIEEVATAAGETGVAAPTQWFQTYFLKDRAVTKELVQRAAAANYAAICITVDAPLVGRRENMIRLGPGLPPEAKMANIDSTRFPGGIGVFNGSIDPSASWKDLEWLSSVCSLPIVLKGILRSDDARKAVDCGARAIIVSNHGGRQLDTTVSSVEALAGLDQDIFKNIEVLFDGGIRRGTDILKAIALGAKAVLIGRPASWALACGGEDAVVHVLELLRAELQMAMALSGCQRLADVDRSLLLMQ